MCNHRAPSGTQESHSWEKFRGVPFTDGELENKSKCKANILPGTQISDLYSAHIPVKWEGLDQKASAQEIKAPQYAGKLW